MFYDLNNNIDKRIEIGGKNIKVNKRQIPELFIHTTLKSEEITLTDKNGTVRYSMKYKQTDYLYPKTVLHSDYGESTVVKFDEKGKKIREWFFRDGKRASKEDLLKNAWQKVVNDD